MKSLFKSMVSTLGDVFNGAGSFDGDSFAQTQAQLSTRHRVTVALPRDPANAFYVVYSRVAPDEALLTRDSARPIDFDAFDTAEAGEVLNVLVDSGYHRIHAVWAHRAAFENASDDVLATAVPRNPEAGILLFEGDVDSDVGLA